MPIQRYTPNQNFARTSGASQNPSAATSSRGASVAGQASLNPRAASPGLRDPRSRTARPSQPIPTQDGSHRASAFESARHESEINDPPPRYSAAPPALPAPRVAPSHLPSSTADLFRTIGVDFSELERLPKQLNNLFEDGYGLDVIGAVFDRFRATGQQAVNELARLKSELGRFAQEGVGHLPAANGLLNHRLLTALSGIERGMLDVYARHTRGQDAPPAYSPPATQPRAGLPHSRVGTAAIPVDGPGLPGLAVPAQPRSRPSLVAASAGHSSRAQPQAASSNANADSDPVGDFMYRHDDAEEARRFPELHPPVNRLDISYHEQSLRSGNSTTLRLAQHHLEMDARRMLEHWRNRRGDLAGRYSTVDPALASQLRQSALPRVLDEYSRMLTRFKEAESDAGLLHGLERLHQPEAALPREIVDSLKSSLGWHALIDESRVRLEAQGLLDPNWRPFFETPQLRTAR